MSLTAEQQCQLLDQVRQGARTQREAACQALLADFRHPALSVISRTLFAAGLGLEHAEEVWQQCLFRFFTVGIASYRGESSVRTYFLRTALHAAVDLVRKASRELSVEPLHFDARPAPASADRLTTDQLRTLEALRRCLSQLSGDLGRAVQLYYFAELGNCAACARELQISPAAFMKRLERARRQLHACVKRRLLRLRAPTEPKEGDDGR